MRLFLYPVALTMATTAAGEEPGAPAVPSQVQTAIAGYAAHIHSFQKYRCRYKLTHADAASVEDAIALRWANAISCECRLLVDEDREKFEADAPPVSQTEGRPIQGSRGLAATSAWFVTEKFLADKDRQINFDETMRVANLFRSGKPGVMRNPTPLNQGYLGPKCRFGPDYRLAHTDEFEFAGGGTEPLEGVPCAKATFRQRDSGNVVTFLLDPSRGYLPVRGYKWYRGMGSPAADPKTRIHLLAARECPDGRWFPEHVVSVTAPDQPGGRFDVTEIKLIELDPSSRPTDADFSIVLPAGTAISAPNIAEVKGVSFRTKQTEKISLHDLEGTFAMLNKRHADPLADTALPRATGWTWKRWALVVGPVAVLGAVTAARRRRRTRDS